MSFNVDLKRGKYYETKALENLKTHGFKKLKIYEGYKKEYDISGRFKKKKVYIECKYSKYVSYTNKIFIEVFTTKFKESGITATRSDYYILYSYFDYWIIETDELKRALEEHLRSVCNIKNATHIQLIDYIKENGCYTNNTIGVIIPMDTIQKRCIFYGNHKKRN